MGFRPSNSDLGTIDSNSLEEKSSAFEAPTFPDLVTKSEFTLESRQIKSKKKKANKIRNIDILIFGES